MIVENFYTFKCLFVSKGTHITKPRTPSIRQNGLYLGTMHGIMSGIMYGKLCMELYIEICNMHGTV